VKHIRFHDLRHIAASIMLNHGIPLLTVSYILGHSQPSTTLNMYGHQFSAMELQAACLVDDIFINPEFNCKLNPVRCCGVSFSLES
jgi:hypothetical protein